MSSSPLRAMPLALMLALLIAVLLAATAQAVLPPSAGEAMEPFIQQATPTPTNIIVSPDTDGDVGSGADLKLDANGNPIVAYYDRTNGDLKVLHCGNPTCTAGNTVVSPDIYGDVGLYPSLALDGAGNPMVAYYDSTNGDLRVLHCGNATCTAGNIIVSPDTVGDVGYAPSLTIDSNGNPAVAYTDRTNGDLKVLRCGDPSCTADNSIVSPVTYGSTGYGPALALDVRGNPVIAYSDVGNPKLKLLYCGNPNCTFSNVDVTIEDYAGGASLVLDASGNPVISYRGYSNYRPTLTVAHCLNPTCTSKTRNYPDPDLDVSSSSLVLDASGNPVVTYYDYNNHRLKVLHCGSATCWSGNTIAVPDPAPGVGGSSSLALDVSGNPVVSYYDEVRGDLKVLHCGNPVCTAGIPTPTPTPVTGNVIAAPDTEGNVGASTSLKLDANGNPVVSYTPYLGGNLRLLHCGNPPCTAGNTITMPVTSTGLFPSMALDGGGNPVIGYYDTTSYHVKVLHCGNPTCTAGNAIATVANFGGSVIGPLSLGLDGGGNPVISYYDGTNRDLKVVHCGNPTCTAGNTIAAPDTEGDVGGGSSVAVDANGNPVVSYYDSTNRRVKVLHCGNPACIAGNIIVSPDPAGYGGTSLALDANGNPVVAYASGSYPDYDLRVLHCGNPTCAAGNTIASPDTVGSVGMNASLRLDANGNPVIAYLDDTNGDLKVLHCGNPTCTANNYMASPDVVGRVGEYASIALDSSGKPAISYYDRTNGDLKVLRCGDPNCGGQIVATPTTTSTPVPTITPTITPTPRFSPTPTNTATATTIPTSTLTPTPTPKPGFNVELVGRYDTPGGASAVAVVNNYAYVADAQGGLRIIDIADPTRPTEVGYYYTPGTAVDVAVAGRYAYVADTQNGLRIVDVSDPTRPMGVGYYDPPTSATGVAVVGSFAYLAEALSGLRIIDVSDPTRPSEVGYNSEPWYATDVTVVGSYAYVAEDSGAINAINVQDPSRPALAGLYFTQGSTYGVSVAGSLAYLADGSPGLRIIEVSDPAHMRQVGYYDTPGYAYDVAIQETYAYVADGGSGLRIIDVFDTTKLAEVGYYQTPDYSYGVAVAGSYVYLVAGGSGLFILRFTAPPPTPTPSVTLTATSTNTPTMTHTPTVTPTPTNTPTPTSTPTSTNTPTVTPTPTPTNTPTVTPTRTPTPTPTVTPTPTLTPTPRLGTPGPTGQLAGQVALQGRRDRSGAVVRAGSQVTTTGHDGSYFLAGLDPGSYTVTVTMTNYLGSQRAPVIIEAGKITTLPPVTLLAGDIRDDGVVNILDLVIVAAAFGSDPTKPHWNPEADLNLDNKVNIQDLVLVAVNFGKRAPSPWP